MSSPIPGKKNLIKSTKGTGVNVSGPKLSVDPMVPGGGSFNESTGKFTTKPRTSGGIAKAKTVNPVYNTY